MCDILTDPDRVQKEELQTAPISCPFKCAVCTPDCAMLLPADQRPQAPAIRTF